MCDSDEEEHIWPKMLMTICTDSDMGCANRPYESVRLPRIDRPSSVRRRVEKSDLDEWTISRFSTSGHATENGQYDYEGEMLHCKVSLTIYAKLIVCVKWRKRDFVRLAEIVEDYWLEYTPEGFDLSPDNGVMMKVRETDTGKLVRKCYVEWENENLQTELGRLNPRALQYTLEMVASWRN